MAVTDDERRLVAERLRMSDERDAAGFVDCLLAEVIRGREFCETPCEECHARLLGELADLIEPEPERTCRMADNGCEFCCSECDGRCGYDDEPNYCPHCGAKVVDE